MAPFRTRTQLLDHVAQLFPGGIDEVRVRPWIFLETGGCFTEGCPHDHESSRTICSHHIRIFVDACVTDRAFDGDGVSAKRAGSVGEALLLTVPDGYFSDVRPGVRGGAVATVTDLDIEDDGESQFLSLENHALDRPDSVRSVLKIESQVDLDGGGEGLDGADDILAVHAESSSRVLPVARPLVREHMEHVCREILDFRFDAHAQYAADTADAFHERIGEGVRSGGGGRVIRGVVHRFVLPTQTYTHVGAGYL